MSRRKLAFVSLLMLAPAAMVCAEVTVLLAIGGSAENDFLKNIVVESSALSLEHRNLSVVLLAEGVAPPISGSQIIPEAIGGLVAESGADFALVSRYELSEDTIKFDFAWYDAESSTITVRETASGKIGLTLDRIIDQTVGKVLDRANTRIAEVRLAKPGDPESADQTATAETSETTSDVSDSTGSTESAETTEGGGQSDTPDGADNIVTEADPPDTPRPKKVDFAAGFATFIAVGSSSDYITLGYNPTLDISFRINLEKGGFLGLGLNTGLNTFQAEGLSLTTRSLVVPIGLDFRYVFESNFPLGVYARLSAGPALFIIQPPEDLLSVLSWDLLMKVIPYATVGLGLRIKLTHFMGFALDMGYSLFLEDASSMFFIMGFTPAATIYFSI